LIKKLTIFIAFLSLAFSGNNLYADQQIQQFECDSKTMFLLGTIVKNNIGDDEIRKMVLEIQDYCKSDDRTLSGFTERKSKLEKMIDDYNANKSNQKEHGKTEVPDSIQPLKAKPIEYNNLKPELISNVEMLKKLNTETERKSSENLTELEPLKAKPLEYKGSKPELISNVEMLKKLNTETERKSSENLTNTESQKQSLQNTKVLKIEMISNSNLSDKVNYYNKNEININSTNESRKNIEEKAFEINQILSKSKVSVWKTESGDFNTSRLVSDSVAGVVLGTADGLITSNIIKKNQEKSGFDDIKCTIGNQVVAGWNDEFRVGVK